MEGGGPLAQPRRLPALRVLRAGVLVRREAERAEGRRAAGARGGGARVRGRSRGAGDARGGAGDGGRRGGARRARGPRARVRIDANVVVLAASAVGSARIALASGLPDPHGSRSAAISASTPGAVVAGRVRRRASTAWRGIPQELYECIFEHLDLRRGERQARLDHPRAFAHSGRRDGVHAAGVRRGSHARDAGVPEARGVHGDGPRRDARAWSSRGTGGDARPSIDYRLARRGFDRAQLAEGLVEACARLLFAAGAREVTIPAVPPQCAATNVRELDALRHRASCGRTRCR